MLHYTVAGTGQPIVLVHGFPNDGRNWNTIIPALSQQYKLIIPDLPGAGKSAFQPELTLGKMADALIAVLDKEQINQAVFAGHSMGGYTILELATLYPDRVKAISLVHSLASADSEEKKETRRKSIKLILGGPIGQKTFIKAMAENLFAASYKVAHPEGIEEIWQNGMQLSPEALAAFYQAIMDRSDKTEWLKANKRIPVQWIIGEEDNATPMKEALAQCYLSQRNDVQLYRNCGHMSMMEYPERLATDLAAFASFVYSM
ncbi:alpha/beta fold hydrolase [Edaphocola flava]|uniref:alpha/beta fold hydrolase n=1 Tax=Edaphocola flava TaxID=2499629 RepID=UPI00100B8E21|nr:alpha/beta hydrolase [Edaphocola flava]